VICKWCGGSITPSDVQCKRCGKEVPALSDCGGFYDLVPGARKTSETRPVVTPTPVTTGSYVRKPEPQKDVQPPRKKQNSPKVLMGLAVITVLGFVLVLSMIVAVMGKLDRYSDAVDGLKKDLRNISEQIEPDDTTEPAADCDSVLAQQDTVIAFRIVQQGFDQNVDASVDMGECSDTVVIHYGYDEQTGVIRTVECSLKEADAAITLSINYAHAFRTQSITMDYEIDEDVFGFSDAPDMCKWQYRFDDQSEWMQIPEEMLVQEERFGQIVLSINDTALEDMIKENSVEPELRCEIVRSNAEGGSLTIVVEGVGFFADANSDRTYD
jgi:hypothetical protein